MLLISGALSPKRPQVSTKEMTCAVGKNSGMLQEAPACLDRDLFPKQQPGQKCEKSLKGSRRGGGREGGTTLEEALRVNR